MRRRSGGTLAWGQVGDGVHGWLVTLHCKRQNQYCPVRKDIVSAKRFKQRSRGEEMHQACAILHIVSFQLTSRYELQ